MAYSNKIQNVSNGINALLILGFLGIVWLMVYGNIESADLYSDRTSSSYSNETITLQSAGDTPAGASGSLENPVISNVIMTNASGGKIIQSANYTVSGVVFYNATDGQYDGTDVNVSYTVSYDGTSTVDTHNLIRNMTGGSKTFFGFSDTIFTIMAIVLLISLLLILLGIVLKISSKKTGGSNSNFSGNVG